VRHDDDRVWPGGAVGEVEPAAKGRRACLIDGAANLMWRAGVQNNGSPHQNGPPNHRADSVLAPVMNRLRQLPRLTATPANEASLFVRPGEAPARLRVRSYPTCPTEKRSVPSAVPAL